MSKVDDVRNAHAIQGSDGNWDYSPYMLGLFNGLEFALAVLEDREPEYREAPASGYREEYAVLVDPSASENQPVPA